MTRISSSLWSGVREWLLGAMVVFGVFWTLLEPLGGFSVVDAYTSRTAMDYLALSLASLLCGAAAVALRTRRDPDGELRPALHQSRARFDVASFVSEAESRICVLGLSLPTFSTEQLAEVFRERLAARVTVRILFVNPMSPVLLQRPRQLYTGQLAPNTAAANTLATLRRFRLSLPTEHAEYLQFRVINILPVTGLVVRDQECIWNPYLLRYTGIRSPYMKEPTEGQGIGPELIQYFQDLWDGADSLAYQGTAAELRVSVSSDPAVQGQLPDPDSVTVERILGETA
ncbi:hypothetical protein [Streptomyces sp. NPDC002187]|uniref:hypothetical protein n=1 Tax=Streptomyces sp. NPDC002187 TaxID=3364637 RepID=UPI00369DF91E